MLMSKDDITEMYRGAKNKIKQISILADMNCCSKKEIRTYLRDECGYEVFEPKGRASKKSAECNKHSNLIGITEKEIRSYVFNMLSNNFQDDICSSLMFRIFRNPDVSLLQVLSYQTSSREPTLQSVACHFALCLLHL